MGSGDESPEDVRRARGDLISVQGGSIPGLGSCLDP